MNYCCFAPYIIKCDSLHKHNDSTFIDFTKTKLSTKTITCESELSICQNHAILHHDKKCTDGNCETYWYECLNTLGRVYTIIATPCEVYITNYEHGFLSNGKCDSSSFGSSIFCFGKIYTNSGIFSSEKNCFVSFEFDGHIFSVEGYRSDCKDIYECSRCAPDQIYLSSMGIDIPEIPDDPQDVVLEEDQSEEDFQSIDINQRTNWGNDPAEFSGQDTVCFDEENVSSWDNSSSGHDDCGSHNNPNVTILNSGHAVIAYENRNKDGNTKISLAVFKTSVSDKIYYYRHLSKGSLLNNSSFSNLSEMQFEIYDDVYVETNDDLSPINSNLRVGFLNGPLSGLLIKIKSIDRITSDAGFIKQVITIINENPFQQQNNLFDVSWFIIDVGNSSLVDSSNISTIISLPYHTYQEKIVPVCNPSVSVPKNNLMIGGENIIGVCYQAFEDKKWNIYITQIFLNDNGEDLPRYVSPYIFETPRLEKVSLQSMSSIVKYKVKDVSEDDTRLCALFEVFLIDGKQVVNCDEVDENDSIYSGCNGTVGSKKNALVDASFNKIFCSSESEPNWIIGEEFTGTYPPDHNTLGINNSSCFEYELYPENINNWCVYNAQCSQHFVFDDPYCPSPYLAVKFNPEDLWTIKTDEKSVTRVLYHMSTALLEDDPSKNVDIIFAVDYSNSMSPYIQDLKNSVPQFAQNLSNNGVSARFGLCIFGRGHDDNITNVAVCNCSTVPEDVFDGLQAQGVIGGFTSESGVLSNSMNAWSTIEGQTAPFSAIKFMLEDDQFQWRPNASKFILMVTDVPNETLEDCSCGIYVNSPDSAESLLIDNQVKLIIAKCEINGNPCDLERLEDISVNSGWDGGIYLFTQSFEEILRLIAPKIITSLVGSRIIERDNYGYESSFIKNAEVVITYNDDLSDYWTSKKSTLSFIDIIPTPGSDTKGITRMPFDLFQGNLYGIDPVHISGNHTNWVYYNNPGPLVYHSDETGKIASNLFSPILIQTNAGKPVLKYNNRNHAIVVFENYDYGTTQISIKGSGDFCQNSITGPKSRRFTRTLTSVDFYWKHDVTLQADGVNQLPDMFIDNNDVVHLCWQSNRDNYWEIYYANASNEFEPIEITKSHKRSGHPSISVDKNGFIFISYHSKTENNFEIMLANNHKERTIPLLEQDAYLASLRKGYNHYTNLLPIFIDNNNTTTVYSNSTLWGVKTADIQGNDNENAIFTLDTNSGSSDYGITYNIQINHIAWTVDHELYGITNDGKLVLISNNKESNNISEDDILIVGDLGINTTSEVLGNTIFEDTFDGHNDNSFISTYGDWTQSKIDSSNVNEVEFRYCSGMIGPCLCHDSGCSGLYTASALNNTACTTDGTTTGDQISNVYLSLMASLSRTPSSDQFVGPTIYLLLRAQKLTHVDLSDSQQRVYIVSIQRTFVQEDNNIYNAWKISVKRNQDSTTQWQSDEEVLRIDELNLPDIKQSEWIKLGSYIYNVNDDVNIDVYINDFKVSSFVDNIVYEQGDPGNPISYGLYYGVASLVGTGEYPSTTSYISAIFDSVKLQKLNSISETKVTTILDMSSDNFGRLWALSVDNYINTDNGQKTVNIFEINKVTGDIQRSTTIYSENITSVSGSMCCTSNHCFYVTTYRDNVEILSKSEYPVIQENSIAFNFSDLFNINYKVQSMSQNHSGNIYFVDDFNDLYILDVSNGSSTLAASLTTGSGTDEHIPISSTSSISFNLKNEQQSGSSDRFHILVDFFDSINLEGTPILSINSKYNLDAFINNESVEESYGAVSIDADGVFLEFGQVGYIVFDATLYRPGFDNLSIPYGFTQNQTYFTKVYTIDSLGVKRETNIPQLNSFSCNKCKREYYNSQDLSACSYSFVFTNTDNSPKNIYLFVDFFNDDSKQNIVRRFSLTTESSQDLQFAEVNNNPAISVWTPDGINMKSGESVFFQIYPNIDPLSGVECGVTYYIEVSFAYSESSYDVIKWDSRDSVPETFKCNCSSSIFGNSAIENINEFNRWESSSFGYSDKNVTHTTHDNFKPTIKSRSDGTSVITWHQVSKKTNEPKVMSATFRPANQDQLRGSGTESWFDYDFNISGKNVSTDIDLFDRIVMSYEKPDSPINGIHGHGISNQELPNTSSFYKVCDFSEYGNPVSISTLSTCDISNKTMNVIRSDDFISSQIIKKIKIHDEMVDYYTYTSSNSLSPVVSKCELKFEIYGTPEIIAYRARNENSSQFSNWCPWSPVLSDYHIETLWNLSPGSGIKKVCFQVMTYHGVTSEFCLTIIADYKKNVYQIKFYIDDSKVGQWPSTDEGLVSLPVFNGVYVASLDPVSVFPKTVLVEIIPYFETTVEMLNFDVIQQGSGDMLNQVAIKETSDGRVVFRGFIQISKEDNIFNIDGFARINPRFSESCEQNISGYSGTSFNKEKYNIMQNQTDYFASTDDTLKSYRQSISGHIGVPIQIRATEDPYFVFGNPDYSITQKEDFQSSISIPIDVTETSGNSGNGDGDNGEGDQGGPPQG